eukprot:scaffold13449_cov179-Ochromonas_danica.AAC.1
MTSHFDKSSYLSYRTARVSNKAADLCTGYTKDNFPVVVRDKAIPNSGFIPNCSKSLVIGDELSPDQWGTLNAWHAGLSCQIYFKHPDQFIVTDVFDNEFEEQFYSAKETIKDENTNIKYQ